MGGPAAPGTAHRLPRASAARARVSGGPDTAPSPESPRWELGNTRSLFPFPMPLSQDPRAPGPTFFPDPLTSRAFPAPGIPPRAFIPGSCRLFFPFLPWSRAKGPAWGKGVCGLAGSLRWPGSGSFETCAQAPRLESLEPFPPPTSELQRLARLSVLLCPVPCPDTRLAAFQNHDL